MPTSDAAEANVASNASGIAINAGNVATNAAEIATNASGISTNATEISTNATSIAANATEISTNANGIANNDADIAMNSSTILAIQGNTVLALDGFLFLDMDAEGNDVARFDQVNVQITNGLGATNGDPMSSPEDPGPTNGLGNLVIGYNEAPGTGRQHVPTVSSPTRRLAKTRTRPGPENSARARTIWSLGLGSSTPPMVDC
jgi:hypothetical protein